MIDLTRSQRKIEGIPSDNGRTVDMIAGALLRIFVRLSELKLRLNRVAPSPGDTRRLAAGRRPSVAEKPSAPPASAAAAPPKPGLGRPPGSPNKKSQENGYDVPPGGFAPGQTPGPKAICALSA